MQDILERVQQIVKQTENLVLFQHVLNAHQVDTTIKPIYRRAKMIEVLDLLLRLIKLLVPFVIWDSIKTKMTNRAAKTTATLDPTLLPTRPPVLFAKKDSFKTKTINPLATVVLLRNTTIKLVPQVVKPANLELTTTKPHVLLTAKRIVPQHLDFT